MTKPYDIINRLFSKELIFETKSGSVEITTDDTGKLRIGALSAPGTSNTLVIDPINNKIQTANITFSDGTYFDSAAGLNSVNSINLFQIKANKIFFKYNSDNTPTDNAQNIIITVNKTSNITGNIEFTFSPNPTNNISLTQTSANTWELSLVEFQKASADVLEITATSDTFTDKINIFKAKDGSNALVGALTNPASFIQVESNGTIPQETLSTYLAIAGGTFTILKGTEDLTGNSSRVTYSIESITQGLSAAINNSGIYTITSFDVSQETGQVVFLATDNATSQQFRSTFSIYTVKKGQKGDQGPSGADGAPGSAGINAKVVKLTIDDAQIAYSASDFYPSPTQIQLTASQQNHSGTIYYEFIVYESGQSTGTTLVNSTSNTLLLTDTNKNYGSNTYTFINNTKTAYKKSKSIKVATREGNSTGTIVAEDSVNIIATRDGSDSLEVVFPNSNHTFVADANGNVSSYSGGGSIVEAYIGNEQLQPINTNEVLANGKFKVTISNSSNITSGQITIGSSNQIVISDPSNMTSDSASITYLISGIDSKGTSKTQTIRVAFSKARKGDAGISALNGILSNETHTIAAENDGKLYNFTSSPLSQAGGSFKIFLGDNILVSGITYSVSGDSTKNGLSISINSSGVYSLTTSNASSWTSNSEVFTLKATYNGVDILKTYTITKSLGGANAKLIKLISSSQTFKKDTNGLYSPSTQTINLTSVLQNITTAVTWSINNNPIGSSVTTVDPNNITISQSQFSNLTGSNSFIIVRASSDGLYDEVTIQAIQDGAKGETGTPAKGISISVDNQVFSFDDAEDNTATPESILVTINQQNLSSAITSSNISILNSSGQSISVPVFTTQNVTNGSGLTIFSIPYNSVNLNDKTKLPITIEVTKDSIYDKMSIYKVEGGKDGIDGATIVLSNESHTFQASSDGTISSFTGGGTEVFVFLGSTQLIADDSTTGFPVNNNSFSVAVDTIFPSGFITLGNKSASGTKIIFADPTAFSNSVDGGTVKYLIKVKDNLGNTRTFEKIQSFSKSKAGVKGVDGANGVDAMTGFLTNESFTIAASSSGEITNFSSTAYNNGSGSFKVFKGTSDISTGNGVAYSVVTPAIKNGLTASINSATGLYTITSSTSNGWTSNSENFTFRAVSGSGGNTVTVDKVYSIVKSLGGANAKLITLNSTSQTFKKDTAGVYSPSSQTISFTASLQNITTTPSWTIDGGSTTGKLTVAPNGLSASMTQAQFTTITSSNGGLTFTRVAASSEGFSDSTTINLVQDGAQGANGTNGVNGTDAISGYLTNESFTIAASSSGEIVAFSSTVYNNGSGSFKVFKGTSDISTGNNVVYSIVGSSIVNGLTASINSTTGLYNITSSTSVGWISNSESFTFRATSGSLNLDKVYSIVKSLGGANAKLVTLNSTGQTFKKDTAGSYSPTTQTISLTASLQNITTTPTWSVDGTAISVGDNSKLTIGTNRLSASMSQAQFDASKGVNNFTRISVSADGYSDSTTLQLIQDGAQGTAGANAKNIAIFLDRQIFSFENADVTTPTPTSILVTIQQQNLASALIAADISITDINNATIATPTLTSNVTSTGGLFNGSVSFALPYSSINSKLKFPIKITAAKDSVSDAISIYHVEGGTDAATYVVSNEAHVFQASNSGVVSSFVGSGTDIKVFIGSTELTASTATTDPVSNNSFTVTSKTLTPSGFVTFAATDRSQVTTTTLRFADVTAVDSAANSGFITYTIKARDNNGTIRTVTKTQTFTKSKEGAAGADPISGYLTNESFTIAASSSGEIVGFSQTVYNNGSGSFKVFRGTTDVSTNGTIAYSVVGGTQTGSPTATSSSLTQNGLIASINLTTGLYRVTSSTSTGWTTNAESFIFRAVSGSTATLDKTYSIAKSLGGANAKIVTLNSTGQTFRKDGTNTYSPASQTIAFTASLQNITTVPTWTVDGGSTAGKLTIINNISASMTQAQFTTAAGAKNYATVTATADGLSDSVTIQLVQDGASGSDGVNGRDGIDTGLIFDFSQTINTGSAIRPWGWNNTAVSNTALSTTNANTSTTILRPTLEPSGGLPYPTDVTVIQNSNAQYGGSLAVLTASFASTPYYRYFYTAYPISVGQNNTYELTYRLNVVDSSGTTADVGLFFYDINGNIIITTNSGVQNSFPHIIPRGEGTKSTAGFTATVTKYYSFETGSSIFQFPAGTVEVKPFIRLTGTATSLRTIQIDKLYFGEKTTPNSRTGIWIDPITGRVTIGEANADITGGSGGLQSSKYDATANFEIISSGSGIGDVSDIKITRAHPYVYTSASYGSDVAIGRDFAAIRFAGWDGTFAGTSISNPGNMKIDERAEIRATYARTGSANQTAGALGGASLDFYTAPSRTTASFLGTTPTLTASAPVLRARITDQGQFLIGYSDASLAVNSYNPIIDAGSSFNSITGDYRPYTVYLFSSEESYPKLAISGGIAARNIVTYDNTIENVLRGTMFADKIYPIPTPDTYTGVTVGSVNDVYNDNINNYLGSSKYRWFKTYTDFIEMSDFAVISSTNAFGTLSRRVYTRWQIDPVLSLTTTNTASPTANYSRLNFRVTDGDTSNSRIIENVEDSDAFDIIAYIEALTGSVASVQLNFTGQHRNIPKDDINNYINKIGLIVVSSGQYDKIEINESLPYVELSTKKNQKSVFGIISNKEDIESTKREYKQGAFVSVYEKENNEDDTKLIINSLGEGAIWICNINGNLENGDYITSCEIPGYGMKQDDDLLHNYTVAKITCDCDFDLNSSIYICEEFEFEGKTYRKAFVGCTYHCG